MQSASNRHMSPAKPLNADVIRILSEVHGEFLKILRRRLRNRADAEEVMQEFYLRVVQHASSLQREGSLRIWLRRVLRSVLVSYVRRQRARERAEANFARKDIVATLQDEEFDRSVCRCMEKLFPALRPDYAEILRRTDIQGQPRETVAEALGLSANNLTVRLHRARRALRRALERTCETCPIHGYFDCACSYMKNLRTLRRAARTRSVLEV